MKSRYDMRTHSAFTSTHTQKPAGNKIKINKKKLIEYKIAPDGEFSSLAFLSN